MGIQRSEITGRKQVNRFHAHSLSLFSQIMENRHFLGSFLKIFTLFEWFFDHNYALSETMSTKPVYFCSTLNFGLLKNHLNPGSVARVFLYFLDLQLEFPPLCNCR